MRRVLVIADEKYSVSISYRQTPGCSGLWLREAHPECHLQNDYQFFINDYNQEVDYVVVRGCAIKTQMEFRLPKANVILVTSEPYSIFEYPQKYCEQFGLVCSCQDNMQGSNILHTPPMLDWFAGIRFEDNKEEVSLTYDDFKQSVIKKKLMSVITSDKLYSKGHYE